MHEFARYPAPSPAAELEVVRRNPFATVVSAAPGGPPTATHAPVVLPADAGDALDGLTLLGHMARANPQWRDFADRPALLLIFAGPHGYVSPSAYGHTPAVPTWNYAAVHVTGSVELIEDRAGALAVVEHTVQAIEALRTPAWDPTSSRARFAELVDGIAAFRVRVQTVRSVFKLSQDMPPEVQDRVRVDLHRHGNAPLAAAMTEHA